MKVKRRYPIGAEVQKKGGVHFRVWAPSQRKVSVVCENLDEKPLTFPLKKEAKGGYFSGFVKEAGAGTLYRFRLSDGLYADLASRYQPEGPFGPSCVIDPEFAWTDKKWKGVTMEKQVIYEMHIGTFTEKGTFDAAMEQLDELADLGITMIELMPLNEFPGHFGWGYDGVNLFAPTRLYGSPDSVKKFVNRAHKLGIGVILDVVYNHIGPEGNFFSKFAKDYFSELDTEWGKAIHFDSPYVREFFLTNAVYWIEEFHFDGLRVDATPWFYCSTPVHILADLSKAAKKAVKNRSVIVIGEDETQNTRLIRPYEKGGYGFDALWNDDFHHTAMVRLTGLREAYYTDYLGSPQEFISTAKYGFLYQGQYYFWQKKNRGSPFLESSPTSFINFLENHDQIANTGHGERLWKRTDPAVYRAITALLLLSPNTPMLFQGQEFGSTAPFYYFADHNEELNQLIFEGRKQFLKQFPRYATKEMAAIVPNPSDPSSFTRCKLNFKERTANSHLYALFKDLIKLRKNDPVISNAYKNRIDGAVLHDLAFLLRYFGEDNQDRLLLFNLGPELILVPNPEPLLAPGLDKEWKVLWSSESPQYGGQGTPPLQVPMFKLLGYSAVVLKSVDRKVKGK